MHRGLAWMALVTVLCSSAACCARPAPGSGRAGVAEALQMHAGSLQELTAVGDDPLLVLWNEAAGTKVFWLSAQVVVTRDGRPATAGDLRVGDLVEVWAVRGSDVATEVVCRSP